jgi:acetolactate synthase-1/2/3 large subunit
VSPVQSATERAARAARPVAGAELLVRALVAAGLRHIFGVPGDTGVAFYDALYHHEDITHVLARDERHAAAMADAYARVTRRLGAVEVSSGGGVTYVVGGLGEAFAASVPVLVVTSDIHRGSRGTGALTEIDQVALFSAVTKEVVVVERAADVFAGVTRAARAAMEGRPGPVAVVVPEDVLDEPAPDGLTASPAPAATTLPPTPADAVGTAAAWLRAARQPAILAGSGVHASRAYTQLAALAETAGAAVTTTIHGKGSIADDHPWSLGVTGNNGGGGAALEWLGDADVVVVVGSRANATDTDSFRCPPRSARVIAVDVDPSRVGRNYPGALLLRGDAAAALAQIRAALDPAAPAGERQARLRRARARHASRRSRPDPPAGTLLVDDVVEALDAATAAHAARGAAGELPVVVADPGTPTPAVASRWPVRQPGPSFVVPRGHGPMGYAIPAAVGAALAAPGRPVVALTADGSFAMSCGELETVARLHLPIVMVQLTNDSLGWIKMLQHLYHEDRFFGVDPGPIDAVAVARACGLRAERPASVTELGTLVTGALEEGSPLYLDVRVPHPIDVVPQVPSWHRALSGDRRRPVY